MSVYAEERPIQQNMPAASSPGFPQVQRPGREVGLQLRLASERGRLHDVKRLLAAGAPIMRDPNGLNALHKACKHGHVAVIKLLIACKRFNLNQPDKYGWTPLHWAAWNGHVEAAQVLVASNRCNNNTVDKSGSNALHCAALNGHEDIIRVLVEAKCNPNLQRRDGWSPLHLACWNGHYDAAQELVASKCKINTRTNEGMGALHLAAAKGYDDIVQLMLDSGIAPDMQDKNGNTALHEAARWCHLTTIKVLITSYCRANIKNNDGDTPLDTARKEGHSKIVAELSGPIGNSISTFEESFGSEELRRLLFHDKMAFKVDSSKQEKSKWLMDIESKTPDSLAGRTSKGSDSKPFTVDSCWQETLERAQDGVKTKYGSRIAEVEKSYRDKVDQIERKCSLKMRLMKHLDENRSPSAPEPKFNFVIHPPSASRPDSL